MWTGKVMLIGGKYSSNDLRNCVRCSVKLCFKISDTASPSSSRYSLMVSKQSNLLHCTCWYQGLNFIFTYVTLSLVESRVMLWHCTSRLNSFNLRKISARYTNCSNQETPVKQLANDVSFLNKQFQFLHSVQIPLPGPYDETASSNQQTLAQKTIFSYSLPMSL
jgi:hypothetical protein